MPTAITCIWDRQEITVAKAFEIRQQNDDACFLCVNCGERVRPHASGGHTHAHFEHISRNPGCPNSHSDSYRYGGIPSESYKNTDTDAGIEGYATERKYLAHKRNVALVVQRKRLDNYTCQTCGYSKRVNGRSIVECHHLLPLAGHHVRVTSLDDLICLCPNCHRVAHTATPPLSLSAIKSL